MRSLAVRRLAEPELDSALPLLAEEGWTFERAEIARLASLGSAWGAFDGARLVAFLTTLEMPPVRWVGNVVVASDARGQGLGERLVRDAIQGARTAGLYSVERAVTLYERLGFVADGAAFAMAAGPVTTDPRAQPAAPYARSDRADVLALDREATRMDRSRLLDALLAAFPAHARVVREGGRLTGFGIAKTWTGSTELGPVVATTDAARDALLDALLESTPGPWDATVLEANVGALRALGSRGFTRRFRTVLMFKGAPPAWRADALAAAAGLEKG